MKILYVTPQRQPAQLAAHALRAISPNCTLAWARTVDSALRWVQDNRDAAALILDCAGEPDVARLIERARAIDPPPPVMIAPALQLAAIAGALRKQSLAQGRREADQRYRSERAALEARVADLQAQRSAASARDGRICTALQQRLFELEASLSQAEERYASLAGTRAAEASRAAARQRELEDALLQADERYASLERTRAAEAAAAAAREQRIRAESAAKRRRSVRTAVAVRRRGRRTRRELESQLAHERHAHAKSLVAGNEEVARLQQGVKTFREELDRLRAEIVAQRREADALRRDAEELPHVRLQLEESERERHRQSEEAPYALCRCTREGKVTQVNDAFVRLLGYRRAADLKRADLSSLLECADDFRWVVERSLNARTTESVDTAVKTLDGQRLHVRLRARATPNGAVEIAVHDTTAERELERRLKHAQRMEAVGRLAAEVAETCDALLSDVTHGGRQWLAAVGGDSALRQRGELLFGDVARAASFLRQFAVYGATQISALEPVNVQRVLQGLEPVLKRLAGGDIKLSLPRIPLPLEVDVDADRLERILVNVASYARERLPHGGRIDVDVAETVVDRRFLATYPAVRPGAHVLITVNQVPRSARQVMPPELQPQQYSAVGSRSPAEKPGVDLAVLLELIRDCDGHLWITAEPSGNMILKIYLPKREAEAAAELAGSAPRSSRARPLARLFRH